MGEYIRKDGVEIKVGVLDELWLTREELHRLKADGWRGYCGGRWTDEIEQHLKEPGTLFLSSFWDHEQFKNERRTAFDNDNLYGYGRNNRALQVFFPLASADMLEHKPVYVWQKGSCGNGYQYVVKCHYDKECDTYNKHTGRNQYFCATIYGERYKDGVGRTILACDCCGALFSVGKAELANVQGDKFISQFVLARDRGVEQVTATGIPA